MNSFMYIENDLNVCIESFHRLGKKVTVKFIIRMIINSKHILLCLLILQSYGNKRREKRKKRVYIKIELSEFSEFS